MYRLLIALLAAFDAVLAAAGGLALALAPLTLLWVFGLGGGADWGALWPAAGAVWQFGNLVPLHLALGDVYVVAAGVDPAAASFTLSLAPLAFTLFTALFAARSGRRAAVAGAEFTGPLAGTLVFAAIATLVALTAVTPVAAAATWQAILFPTLVFAVPALLGAFVAAWRTADRGAVADLRGRADALHGAWPHLPALLARGTAVATLGLAAVGALVVAIAVFSRGGQIVALFSAGNVDAVGATVIALGQLAYLPTLVVWGASFAAGPGFALGADTAVSPAGTSLGVVPGIPILGAVPESTSPWLLLLALLPIAVGAFSGWMLRSRLAALPAAAQHPADGGVPLRLALTGGLALLVGGLTALAAAIASGSLGPGRLADVGPAPGAVALTVGLEVLLGAAILLLAPRRAGEVAPAWTTPAAAPVDDRPREVDALWRSISASPLYVHETEEVPRLDTVAPADDAEPADAKAADPDTEAWAAGWRTATWPEPGAAGTTPENDRDATGPIEPYDPDATGPIEPFDPERKQGPGTSLD